MRWLVIIPLLVAGAWADLPSCSRAKCLHCAVEFISRMCPEVCSKCPQTVFDKETVRIGQKLKVFPENNRPKKESNLPPQPPPVHQIQKTVVQHQASQPNQQSQIQQLNQPQFSQSHNQNFGQIQPQVQIPSPAQFGAPNHQIPPQQGQAPAQAQAPTPIQQYQPPQYQGQQQQQYQNQQQFQGQQQYQSQQQYQPQQQQFQSQQQQYQPQQQQYPNPPPPQHIVVTQPPPTPAVIPTGDDTLTLAPLINPPSAEDLNAQLIEQQRLQNAARFPQLPGFGANAGAPPNLFGQPAQTPLFNPFQPFLQQAHGAAAGAQADPLNPFGLPTLPPLFPTSAPPAPQQFQPLAPPQQLQGPQGQYQPQQPQYPQQGQQYQQQQNQQQQFQPQYPQQQGHNQQIPPSPPTPQQFQQGNNQQPQYQTQQINSQQPIISRSIDQAPQQYEKNFYTGINAGAGGGKEVAQCPRQPNWQPCISKGEANNRFKNCCKRLGDGCLPLCNYDANLTTMQLAVLTGRCPITKVRDIMICASGYKDATQCCEAYNVFEAGYEHCRPYCNPAAGLPEGGLLSEKYKCLVKLGNIQQCFYVSQNP